LLDKKRPIQGFWTPAITRPSARSANRRPKSAKARSRGQLGAGWQRVLWGLCVGAELDGGREASTTPPACLHVPEVGRAQKAFRRALGAHQRAIDALMDVIGSSEIAAGVEPAHKAATLTEGLAHDESILLGVGRHLGSQSRAKTSMTIMRAPQSGHEQARRCHSIAQNVTILPKGEENHEAARLHCRSDVRGRNGTGAGYWESLPDRT